MTKEDDDRARSEAWERQLIKDGEKRLRDAEHARKQQAADDERKRREGK